MKLAVVILHWEDDRTTATCLKAVLVAANFAQPFSSTHRYIVDNGSEVTFSLEGGCTDPDTKISVIRNSENLGFARGMNTGIVAAVNEGADAVWLLNNDTRPLPSAIAELLTHHREHPAVGCIGSTISQACGELIHTVGGYRYRPWSSRAIPLGRGRLLSDASQHAKTYDYVCGSAIFLAAACLRKIGGLPECNFLYFEELNLAKALKSHEIKSDVCTGAIVIHHQGSSISRLPLEKQHYYLTISALKFTKKHYMAFLPTVVFMRLMGTCYSAYRSSSFAPMRGFASALRTLFFNQSTKALREKHNG